MRYAIKHIPSGKFYYEDESGSHLLNESEGFITYGDKSKVENILNKWIKFSPTIATDDGIFNVNDFKISEL